MSGNKLAAVLAPAHLKRTGLIALIVGSWLTAFNQGDALRGNELGASGYRTARTRARPRRRTPRPPRGVHGLQVRDANIASTGVWNRWLE